MTYPKPSPDGLFNRILAVSRPAVRNRHALEHNSIYILFKSTFTMKHILSTMMALCCIVGLGRAQLSPLSSVGYSTEAPLGYWLVLETVTSHSGGELEGLRDDDEIACY